MIGGGVTYAELIKALEKEKMALKVLPSDLSMNVIGSIVTGTHGSGIRNQQIAASVNTLAFVNP